MTSPPDWSSHFGDKQLFEIRPCPQVRKVISFVHAWLEEKLRVGKSEERNCHCSLDVMLIRAGT
jgi:hypothetical protein